MFADVDMPCKLFNAHISSSCYTSYFTLNNRMISTKTNLKKKKKGKNDMPYYLFVHLFYFSNWIGVEECYVGAKRRQLPHCDCIILSLLSEFLWIRKVSDMVHRTKYALQHTSALLCTFSIYLLIYASCITCNNYSCHGGLIMRLRWHYN